MTFLRLLPQSLLGHAVDIGEVGVDTAQFLCPGIHHFRKAFFGAADVFCDGVGQIVGGRKHQGIKGILHGKLFALVYPDTAGIHVNVINGIMGNGNGFSQSGVFFLKNVSRIGPAVEIL